MASKRYLAAIMFTDLVGYTSMMGEDEAKALSVIRKNRELHKRLIKKHNGVWLKEMGDGVLARFHAASDAVYCAGAILGEAKKHDITLRIGIHLGEIVEDGGDVFGDGVNVAARIESAGEPGAIYTSEPIARNVRNKAGISSEFVHSQPLKNVADPVNLYKVTVKEDIADSVASSGERKLGTGFFSSDTSWWKPAALALIALTAILAGWVFWEGDPARVPTANAIAVLPFEAFGEAQSSSFVKGIQGGVLTRLSNVSSLKVTSRTSTLQYEKEMKSVKQIANELNVDWIVRGEVQETAQEVQVNARLVNARKDQQVWAKNYRRKLTANNLFEIQSELAMHIAEELQASISPEEKDRVERKPTENLDAYRLYAQGLLLLEQRTPQAVLESVQYFLRATEKDSSYAPAWALLGRTLIYIDAYGYDSLENYDVVPRETIRRALALNPELAEAHASQGIFYYTKKDGPAAIKSLKRSIELQPSYEIAHNWMGFLYLLLGQPDDALYHSKMAIELNPLAPASRLYPSLSYWANGMTKKALQEVTRAREIQPEWGEVYAIQGMILYDEKKYNQAQQALIKADSLIGFRRSIWIPEVPAMQAVTYAGLNEDAKAAQKIKAMDPQANIFWTGLTEAALGNHEKAWTAFGRIEQFSMWPNLSLRYLFADILDPMRDDPRYDEIINKMNQSWNVNYARTKQ